VFISFEGIDGCGKSTQCVLLSSRLQGLGASVTLTREPGGTRLAEDVRALLLNGESLSSQAELLLFGASRAQHVEEIIRPALSRGEWVISDRFGDSSVAYQGGGLGLDTEFVARMNAFATGDLRPALTFLLDLSPEDAQRRLQAQGAPEDRIEARGAEFYTRVCDGYLQLASREPERIIVLDAMPPAKVVHERIVKALKKRELWPENASDNR
jgi:dTMP kinase